MNTILKKKAIYQQMSLIKLKGMSVVPLVEVKRQLDKEFGKKTLDINELEKEGSPDLEETNEAKKSQHIQCKQTRFY